MWRSSLTGIWFHDLRRSFVTNARRRGVPESVVMVGAGAAMTIEEIPPFLYFRF